MTGLGRPPRADPLLQSKNKLTRSHRTRPPPADTRRACCHVLSSFQRTGLACPPSSTSRPSSGEPFKLTNPPTVCQALISTRPSFGSRFASCLPHVRRDIHARARHGPERASRRQPCQQARHGAWRFLGLEGRDARRLLSTWDTVRLPLRARHLAASQANIRVCDGGVNRECQKKLRRPQATVKKGVAPPELPLDDGSQPTRAGSRCRDDLATRPSSAP